MGICNQQNLKDNKSLFVVQKVRCLARDLLIYLADSDKTKADSDKISPGR